MPRYFLDVRFASSLSVDEEGATFADFAAAEREALLSVLELAGIYPEKALEGLSVDVRNDSGRHLASVAVRIGIVRNE